MTHHTTHAAAGTILSAGSLKGTKVVNAAGDDLGSIEEIMLYTDTGETAYPVLSFGGFLGLGDELFAVPCQALAVDTANERITLDVTREQLDNAPGFDEDNWPMSPDDTWLQDVHSHYGYEYERRTH